MKKDKYDRAIEWIKKNHPTQEALFVLWLAKDKAHITYPLFKHLAGEQNCPSVLAAPLKKSTTRLSIYKDKKYLTTGSFLKVKHLQYFAKWQRIYDKREKYLNGGN